MSNIPKNTLRILRFLTGALSAEEAAAFRRAREGSPELQRDSHELEQTWQAVSAYKSGKKPDVSNAWAAFEARSAQSGSSSRRPMHVRVAAALLLLLGMAVAWHFFLRDSQPTLMAETKASERLDFELPDGSKVWLNERSTLHCIDCSSSFSRKLILSGEGYFQVAHDASKVFEVRGTGTSVQVLGTQFNFRSYANELMEEVEVTSGSVRVQTKSAVQVLGANQLYRFDSNTAEVSLKQVAHRNGAAWKSGKLKFLGIPFSEAIEYLERFYGVTINTDQINPEVMSCTYSGQFSRENTFTEVQQSLEEQYKLRFELEGDDTYSLYEGLCL